MCHIFHNRRFDRAVTHEIKAARYIPDDPYRVRFITIKTFYCNTLLLLGLQRLFLPKLSLRQTEEHGAYQEVRSQELQLPAPCGPLQETYVHQ